MGGNLFLNSKRINNTEYYQSLKDIRNIVSDKYTLTTIESVGEKEDHGDIDLLITNVNVFDDIIEYCLNNNYPYYIQNDKQFLSFLLHNTCQVDLILSDNLSLDYSKKYFSYNDLGNILGRMLRYYRYKHKHNGLYYNHINPYNSSISTDILLSLNYETILNLLHLDIDKFNNGFSTYKEMFEYIQSSPFYKSELFLFENLNNKNKVRDKKRKTYNMFLEHCKEFPVEYNINPVMLSPFNYNFEQISNTSLLEIVTNLDNQYLEHMDFSQRFNGHIVSEITSLKNLELGLFMKDFHKTYPITQLKKLTDTEIKILIKNFKKI